MRRFAIILSALLFCNVIVAQRNQISRYEPADARRGFVRDFSGFQKFTDRNSGIEYFLANDNSNLYILYRATNKLMQRKLIRTGMLLEFQVPDRNEKTARISFPPDPIASQPSARSSQIADLKSRKEAYISRISLFSGGGFERTNGQLALRKPAGLRGQVLQDSLSLSYELIIPLEELFGAGFSMRDISRLEITLLATIEAIPRPQTERPRGNIPPDDRLGSPTTRRPGGGMYPGDYNRVPSGGPRYVPVDGSTDLLFRKQRIKRKFRLAPGANQ